VRIQGVDNSRKERSATRWFSDPHKIPLSKDLLSITLQATASGSASLQIQAEALPGFACPT
jgi:hypothetical protein